MGLDGWPGIFNPHAMTSSSLSPDSRKMTRNAFKMKLKPGCVAEYQRRHDEIWPALVVELRTAGITDYSIFLDEETLTLFAVQKWAENHTADRLPQLPIVRQWWESMAPLMETLPDHTPVCLPLREVFHLD
jgi:L-rhamnose mutarotase